MGQLNVEMLKASTGIYATHIPYRGGTHLITAVLSNEVQFILDNLVIMLPLHQGRKGACAGGGFRTAPAAAARCCRPWPSWAIRSST
ncbi:tripartite tricarboxylate transporter substrate-binding protein [Bradyrhizobium betae]